ncbi:T9SS type A sorting domain-containing protein [bacterium SCSIO 12741]|nr:T9SS type A sorting domain-containing protein [bacterium SCSIO 12741]
MNRVLPLLGLCLPFWAWSQTGPAGVESTNGSSNLFLWLDASQIEGVSDDNNITTWNDLSGYDHHASNNSPSLKPNLYLNEVNGLPVVRFDGNNEELNGTFSSAGTPVTTFTVCYFASANQGSEDNDYVFSVGSTASAGSMFNLARRKSNDGNADEYYSYDGDTRYYGPTLSGQTWQIIHQELNSSATYHSLNLNGSNQTVTDFGSAISTDGIFRIGDYTSSVGTKHQFNGNLAEIIFYNRILNSAETNLVNSYLGGKYDITVNNDKYAGDDNANGDFDQNIIGIGQEADGNSDSATAAGLMLGINSNFENGDYLVAGHASAENSVNTADASDAGGTLEARWGRIWYLDQTNTSTAISANFTFRLDYSGLGGNTQGLASNYQLLYRSSNSGNWTLLASGSAHYGKFVTFSNVTISSDGYYTLGTIDQTNSPIGVAATTAGNDGPGGLENTGGSSNLEMWLKPSDISGDDQDYVLTLEDQSGKNHHATQGTLNNIPLLNVSGANGLNTLEFDGVADYLTGNMSANLNAPLTIISVARFASTNQGSNDNDYVFSIGANGTNNQHTSITRRKNDTPADADKFYSWDGNGTQFGPTITGQQWNIYTQVHQTSSPYHNLYIDNTSQTVSDYSASLSTDGSFSIGRWNSGAHYLSGELGDVIVFTKVLNTAERHIVHSYLGAKFNLSVESDKYSGDDNGNGDYDLEVAGVGTESDGSNSAASSAGLHISQKSNFGNGDYLLFGHKVAKNNAVQTDITTTSGSLSARWERVWFLDQTDVGAGMTIDLTFDFSDAGFGGYPYGTASDYKLLYRSGQSGSWTILASASSYSNDQVLFSDLAINNDGYYTLGTADLAGSPLPVELQDFNAQLTDQHWVHLHWSTVSEVNLAHFEVERLTTKGTFESLEKVPAQGFSNQEQFYQTMDNLLEEKDQYYRLKMVDLDGTQSYSSVVKVAPQKRVQRNGLRVFPNPTDGFLHLQLPLDSELGQIKIYSSLGQPVLEQNLAPQEKHTLDLSHLKKGLYLLQLGNESRWISVQ